MNLVELAGRIDHTVLKPETQRTDIQKACFVAIEYGVATACVSSSRVADAAEYLAGSAVPVCAVIGFDSGAVNTAGKVAEARQAKEDGAEEFDMVINLGALFDGDYWKVDKDISAVKKAVGSNLLKVIIESAVLDEQNIVTACQLAVGAGADFVKTSTGFHPAGGATEEAVRLMRETVPAHIGVKAAGGLRTPEGLLGVIVAGADRVGLSETVPIFGKLEKSPDLILQLAII